MKTPAANVRRVAALAVWIGAVIVPSAAPAQDQRVPSAAVEAAAPPMTEGDWYRPDADITWQWQLTGSIETGYEADIYDVDLFDTPASVIASLQARGRKVFCYFSAGSFEPWRPDSDTFPATAIGAPLDGYPDERWLDVRRPDVFAIMEARLDLARARGCDGVEPDNVDGYSNDSGFPLTADDQVAFNRTIANAAHERSLSIALKNAGGLADQLVAYFDLALNEQCHQYRECDLLRPFADAGKPILNAEYADDAAEAGRQVGRLCRRANAAGLRTLILPHDLDDSFRAACF